VWSGAACTECDDYNACPVVAGKWYKDTMILSIPKVCPPTLQPMRPSFLVNPGQTIDISSFTVKDLHNNEKDVGSFILSNNVGN